MDILEHHECRICKYNWTDQEKSDICLFCENEHEKDGFNLLERQLDVLENIPMHYFPQILRLMYASLQDQWKDHYEQEHDDTE